jgi:hypothetical protein
MKDILYDNIPKVATKILPWFIDDQTNSFNAKASKEYPIQYPTHRGWKEPHYFCEDTFLFAQDPFLFRDPVSWQIQMELVEQKKLSLGIKVQSYFTQEYSTNERGCSMTVLLLVILNESFRNWIETWFCFYLEKMQKSVGY